MTETPASYVNVSLTEVPPGSIFETGRVLPNGCMMAFTRTSCTIKIKHELLIRLAVAWSEAIRKPVKGFALFFQEVSGSAVMEDSEILSESSED